MHWLLSVVMFKVNGSWWGNSKATGSLCCQPQIQKVKNPFFTSFCDKSNDKSPKYNRNGTKRWNMHQWQKKLPLDQITSFYSRLYCVYNHSKTYCPNKEKGKHKVNTEVRRIIEYQGKARVQQDVVRLSANRIWMYFHGS